jgi:hypothetical protein
MATYRIHRLKDAPRQQFRFAPHTGGAATVKARDYEPAGQVEAQNEYDAWARLRQAEQPLVLGDLLETAEGELRIYKYVGFEAAQWHIPEPRPAPATEAENPQPA